MKAGSFRIVPKVDLYVGGGDNAGLLNNFLGFFTVGLGFFWELPLDKPVAVNASVQPAY